MVVETQGQSGGIPLLWRRKDEVLLRSFNKNHINVVVQMKEDNTFRLTRIHGEPDRSKRSETWQLIRNLSRDNSMPWVLIGDMNNVCSQEDKKGGRPYPQSLITGFIDVLEDCNLIDINLVGYPYTWEIGAETSDWIEVRLDRALITVEFINTFKDVTLTNLEVSTSDNCLLFLELYKMHHYVTSRSFRFENAWLREPMCQQMMSEVWERNEERLRQNCRLYRGAICLGSTNH